MSALDAHKPWVLTWCCVRGAAVASRSVSAIEPYPRQPAHAAQPQPLRSAVDVQPGGRSWPQEASHEGAGHGRAEGSGEPALDAEKRLLCSRTCCWGVSPGWPDCWVLSGPVCCRIRPSSCDSSHPCVLCLSCVLYGPECPVGCRCRPSSLTTLSLRSSAKPTTTCMPSSKAQRSGSSMMCALSLRISSALLQIPPYKRRSRFKELLVQNLLVLPCEIRGLLLSRLSSFSRAKTAWWSTEVHHASASLMVTSIGGCTCMSLSCLKLALP